MKDFNVASAEKDFEVIPKKTKIKILDKCGPGRIGPSSDGLTTYTALIRNSLFCYVALKDPDIKPLTEVYRDELLDASYSFENHVFFIQHPSITPTLITVDLELPKDPTSTDVSDDKPLPAKESRPKVDVMDITRAICLQYK